MATGSSMTADLQQASNQSYEAQVTILRRVKNYVTGHELRKKELVQGGLIPCLSTLLQQAVRDGVQGTVEEKKTLELWTQAANILCVMANGGPPFVHPILKSPVLPRLVSCLTLESDARLILSILRCLNTIADNLPLSTTKSWSSDRRLVDLLYRAENVSFFSRIISLSARTTTAEAASDAATALVCKTCSSDARRKILFKSGALTALCDRLARLIVRDGFVIPKVDRESMELSERSTAIPIQAPTYAKLAPTLEAIGTLIETSKTHASALINNPSITTVLPAQSVGVSLADVRTTPWGETYLSGGAVPRSSPKTLLDSLLPHVPEIEKSSVPEDTNFPSLGSIAPKRRASSVRTVAEKPMVGIPEAIPDQEDESLLVPWLLYVVRAYPKLERLLACRVLVALYKHKLLKPSRSSTFGALLVPVLVRLLDDESSKSVQYEKLSTGMPYIQLVPFVLSQLIEDDQELQDITVETKTIPKLALSLKKNFDQRTSSRLSLWKPLQNTTSTATSNSECALGAGGPSLQDRHNMMHREGLLRALAAIAPTDDRHRKEICDQGVVVQIMQALEPFHGEPKLIDDEPIISTTGNSASTLLAACSAVRALTRSVTALRTKLVDADVAKPIIRLMHNIDPEVRVAATKVIANLAMDFSPMKAAVSESELVKKLCEQVHSANARLRLESIWALKTLVLNSPNKLRKEVVDELGANWIRHLIATDPYDIPPGEVIGLEEKEYLPRSGPRGSRNLDDVIMSDGSEDDNTPIGSDWSIDEHDYNTHTVEDDLAVQEQLLDLIRNLTCGDTALEIVEYLTSEIGYEEFVSILMDRLRTKTVSGSTRRSNQVSSAPKGIVTKVLYIITHMLASGPKYRNMLISNTSLMKLVATFCNHTDDTIRAQCCWIVINLTYEEDPNDRDGCKQRSAELHRLGFLTHMRRLEHDQNLNVRERAKTAQHLLDKLRP